MCSICTKVMTQGTWGPICYQHKNKSSEGGKGYPVYNEPEKSEAVKSFLKELE